MIGLVDANNFYVSCERIFDSLLVGRPVGILSNNDGCVVSRSNELKALGVAMGTPYFQLKGDIKRLGLILRSSNYELYGDISNRIMSVLAEFVPTVEQYSIDEAFIYPDGASADWEKFGCKIRNTILKWIGVPCGIGFAPTKTLTKIANHIGKKLSSGVYVMPNDLKSVLDKVPVSEVWGVGRRLSPKLEAKNIRTAWDLSVYGDSRLKKAFNVVLVRTAMELRGEACIEQTDSEIKSQSITCSRSFGSPVTSFEHMRESVCNYIGKAAEKLRKEKQRASGINIHFVYYPEYSPQRLDGGYTSCAISFPRTTDDTIEMLHYVSPYLKRIFIEGRRYKKSGVTLWGLESGEVQMDMFMPISSKSDLFAAVDKINAKYGKGAIAPLSEGLQRSWKMKRGNLSPHYTTSWEDIPLAR